MFEEKDIEMIEKYIFGKLSEKGKDDFEQRIAADKNLAEQLEFIRDLKSSSVELGRTELKSKLKAISANQKEIKQNVFSISKSYYAIAASVIGIIGIATIVYLMQTNRGGGETIIAEVNKDSIEVVEINSLIANASPQTKQVKVTSIDKGYGYAQMDTSALSLKMPVSTIVSQKISNKYLYRDTLFLFLSSSEIPSSFILDEKTNQLFFYSNGEYYSIELVNDHTAHIIVKVDSQDVIDKLKKTSNNTR